MHTPLARNPAVQCSAPVTRLRTGWRTGWRPGQSGCEGARNCSLSRQHQFPPASDLTGLLPGGRGRPSRFSARLAEWPRQGWFSWPGTEGMVRRRELAGSAGAAVPGVLTPGVLTPGEPGTAYRATKLRLVMPGGYGPPASGRDAGLRPRHRLGRLLRAPVAWVPGCRARTFVLGTFLRRMRRQGKPGG
jgi:hypothetical protein